MPEEFNPGPIIKAMYHSSSPNPERMARPRDMSNDEDEQEVELQALRDENDSLRQECQELRQSAKEHEDFIDEVTGLLPPSYDEDSSPEGIIIHFLKDIQSISQIFAKLTSDYR